VLQRSDRCAGAINRHRTGWLSGDMQCRQGCSAFELNWSKELTHVEDGIGTKTVMLDLGRLAQTNAQIEQFR
jgi:hypothetical protein